jgi:glucokinase
VTAINAHADVCLALDIGGSKFGAALVDRQGEVRWSAETRTPQSTGAEGLFVEATKLLDGILGRGQTPPLALGVGCAGPIKDRSEVSPLNIPGWRAFPLRQRLEERYGLATFLDVVVSTGIGGGLVLDGRLVEGRTGNAGHVGHIVVVPEGRPCSCGGRGCLESEASGWAITARTGRPPVEATPEVVERTGRLVGRALASVATLCDLDLFVVAGSVAFGFGSGFFRAAQQALGENVEHSFASGARVMPAGLGAWAPLIGCAAVAWRGLGEELLAPTS